MKKIVTFILTLFVVTLSAQPVITQKATHFYNPNTATWDKSLIEHFQYNYENAPTINADVPIEITQNHEGFSERKDHLFSDNDLRLGLKEYTWNPVNRRWEIQRNNVITYNDAGLVLSDMDTFFNGSDIPIRGVVNEYNLDNKPLSVSNLRSCPDGSTYISYRENSTYDELTNSSFTYFLSGDCGQSVFDSIGFVFYQYGDNGCLVDRKYNIPDASLGKRRDQFTYFENCLVATATMSFFDFETNVDSPIERKEYIYENDRLSEEKQYSWSSSQQDFVFNQSKIFRFESNGLVEIEEHFNANGNITYKKRTELDEQGNYISETRETFIPSYDLYFNYQQELTYDENNFLIGRISSFKTSQVEVNRNYQLENYCDGLVFMEEQETYRENNTSSSIESHRIFTEYSESPDCPQFKYDASLVISPNPTEGNFTLKAPGLEIDNAQIRIFDGLGHLVHQQELDFRTQQEFITIHDLGSLAEGIYIVTVDGKGYSASEKLVIAR